MTGSEKAPSSDELARQGSKKNSVSQCFCFQMKALQIQRLAHILKLVNLHLWPKCFFKKTAASVLGFRASEFVCRPFKSRVSISYSPQASPELCPTAVQSQIYGGLSSWYRSTGQGFLIWGLKLLRKDLCICDVPHTCELPCQGCGS